jgi:hypothetical protein
MAITKHPNTRPLSIMAIGKLMAIIVVAKRTLRFSSRGFASGITFSVGCPNGEYRGQLLIKLPFRSW